jgi:hypothetical protein
MGGLRFFFTYEALLQEEEEGLFLNFYYLTEGVSALELMLAFAAFCLPSFTRLWQRWRTTPAYRKSYLAPSTGMRGVGNNSGTSKPTNGILVEDTIELVHEDASDIELSRV